jgi:hypothetical protein
MKDETWKALAIILPSFFGLLIVIIGYLNNRVSKKNHAAIREVQESNQEIKIAIDGRLTELLELTRKASKAEGVKEEKENGNGDKKE